MAEPNQASQFNHAYIYGDVEIDPGVAIAAGVLLGAEPGCRLVVSAGVCLGSDVVIRVSRGNLVIEPGANLGSGVLIVGHGHIGHHACIGASSTVINPTVTPHQVVSPKALLGDPTQPMAQSSVDRATTGNGAMAFADTELPLVATPQPSIPGPSIPPDPPGGIQGIEPPSPAAESGLEAESGLSQASADHLPPNGLAPSSQQDGPSSAPVLANGAHVYGKKQVSQLLETLFPHRRSLNGSAPEDRT